MSVSKRVTSGLAWAGLLLVVAVPSADAITAVFIPRTADVVSPDADQAALDEQPALVAPIPATRRTVVTEQAATPVVEETVVDPIETASTADAVDAFLDQGKPLPSYISGENAAPVDTAVVDPEPVTAGVTAPETEVATVTNDPGIDPVEVASINAPVVVEEAPVPMPAFMRPAGTELATYRPGDGQPAQDVVLPDDAEQELASTDDDRIVTADELEDWEYGPLSDYLERQQNRDSEVTVRRRSSDYDDDGFYLDEGPNRRHNDRELIGPVDDDEEDDFFFPFLN